MDPASRLREWFSRLRKREDQLLILLSLVIGVVVGLVVVGFIVITGRLAARLYPPGSVAWRRLLIPVAGSIISGVLLSRYFPNARGSGIPQTKFALFINDGFIRLRTVVGKFLCCSISLASGIPLGREGPSVQIGAGIASVLGRRFGLGPSNIKALIPVGCAAALAAAFNTPIAAVLFSLEEILGDLHAPVLGSVVLSSATSWMVLHLFLGDEPLFHVPAYRLIHPSEFAIYAALGLVGGLASVCFVKLLLYIRSLFRRLPKTTEWAQPVAGGLLAGLLALWRPQVLGVGYDYVERMLGGGETPLTLSASLAGLKLVATAAAYASGNAGGIFGPSLFIGAMIGGAVGSIAHSLAPAMTANPGAYTLVGMGAAFAGIIRTPLTSVIMIFELTRDYSIIVPLMISNLIAFFISQRLQPEPIYEALALQDGVYLPTGESRSELAGVRVSEVMHPPPEGETEGPHWAVVRDLMQSDSFPFVHSDHPLSLALERMGAARVDALPVVSRANIRQLRGIVTLADILAVYGVKGAF